MHSDEDREPNPGLERARHELRSLTPKPHLTNDMLRSGIHTRGYLPHVKCEGKSYFVTFRLADALPKEVLLKFEAEKAQRLRQLYAAGRRGIPITDTEEAINRDFRRHVERYLDQGHGACHLRRSEIANLVSESILFFEPKRYVLGDWVVMPNHVHVVVWPMPNQVLSSILKTWKQFTSRRAKKMLGIEAEKFWQPESYDHWIRNDDEKARISRYIRNNPVAAGLCPKPELWRWSSSWLEP